MPRTPNTPKVECPKCLGCGRLDSKARKPWCEVTRQPNPDVRAGVVAPVLCDDCQGFGNVDQMPAEPVKPAEPTKAPPAPAKAAPVPAKAPPVPSKPAPKGNP